MEVKTILEAFGEIKAIGRLKAPQSKKKGASKAKREYVAEFSNLIVVLACVNNLNNLPIFGTVWPGILTYSHAFFLSIFVSTLASLPFVSSFPFFFFFLLLFPPLPSLEQELKVKEYQDKVPPTIWWALRLDNLTDPGSLGDENEFREEVRDEAEKFGHIVKIRIAKTPTKVTVYVVFLDESDANAAANTFNGRLFDGRLVQVVANRSARAQCCFLRACVYIYVYEKHHDHLV